MDQTYSREVAARSRVLFAAFWARRAVGVVGFGLVSVIILAAFTVGHMVWPSQPPVEVIFWTWGEKNNVLLPALKRFNELGLTVTVDGRRYRVQARPVSVDPTKMRDALVAKFNDGTDFPQWMLGAPTVISPVNSGWLVQINGDIKQDIFQLDQFRPIVRTPIVILTYRGMAECLGWPEHPIGWIDIITLAENPEGWRVCPTARPEWGEKPLVAFAGPEGSSISGSVRQILHIIAAGKAAEELTPADVDDPGVRTLADRFQAIVDRYYSEAREFQTAICNGPRLVQFVPVEEYTIPRLYQDWANAGDAPGYEVVAIYPKEGTLWHDNPFAIPNVPWVNDVQREAAHLVEEYLRSEEVQARLMKSGFRPGIFVKQSDLLTPPKGLDFKQPAVILDRIPAETARAIQQTWKGDAGISNTALELTIPSRPSTAGQIRNR